MHFDKSSPSVISASKALISAFACAEIAVFTFEPKFPVNTGYLAVDLVFPSSLAVSAYVNDTLPAVFILLK